jgi:hypothetical protein
MHRVECIHDYPHRLTAGKIYEVVGAIENEATGLAPAPMYYVIDDSGGRTSWYTERFVSVVLDANGNPLKVGDLVIDKGGLTGDHLDTMEITHLGIPGSIQLKYQGTSIGWFNSSDVIGMQYISTKDPEILGLPEAKRSTITLELPIEVARGLMEAIRKASANGDPAFQDLYYDYLGPAFTKEPK